MLWVLLGIVVLVLAIKFRRFRYTLLAIVGILVLSIAGYLTTQHAEEEASKKLVRADQLTFTDLRLGPSDYGSSYTLLGRVRNDSRYTVYEVKAEIRVLDCDQNAHCDVVGEEEAWDMCPLLPPGQVRDVNTSVYFGSGTKVHGQFQWNYQITEIRARE